MSSEASRWWRLWLMRRSRAGRIRFRSRCELRASAAPTGTKSRQASELNYQRLNHGGHRGAQLAPLSRSLRIRDLEGILSRSLRNKDLSIKYCIFNKLQLNLDGGRPQSNPWLRAYNNHIMSPISSSTLESQSMLEICARVKHLGYTTSGRVRLYGEEFEVVSEPFADSEGIAVHAKSRKNPNVRVVRLPATVVQSARRSRAA